MGKADSNILFYHSLPDFFAEKSANSENIYPLRENNLITSYLSAERKFYGWKFFDGSDKLFLRICVKVGINKGPGDPLDF